MSRKKKRKPNFEPPERTPVLLRPAYGLAILVAVFFGFKLLPVDGVFIGGIDVGRYFVPNAEFVREQFFSGSLPLWNPHYYSGHPFLANPQTFVFYPATLLFVLLPLPWAFNLDTALHIYIAGMGAYLFVKALSGARLGAAVAAVVYALSGYFMENVGAGHLTMIHTAALLPWIFYLFERGYRSGRIRHFVGAGFVLGLQILSGEPQNNFYTVLFLAVYGVSRYLLTPGPERPRPLYRAAGRAATVPLVALGVSAVQVLPALEFLGFSDRASNTYEFGTFLSFPPRNFYTFLVPKPETALLNTNWEFGGYVGVLALLLAVVGAVWSHRRRETWCLILLALLAVSVMLGQHSPVYRAYFDFVPGFSTFRIPARCLVILVFSLASLAGLGAQRLRDSVLPRRAHAGLLVLLAVFAALIVGGARILEIPLSSGQVLLGLALTAAGAALLGVARGISDRRVVAGLLIALPFLDLALHYAPGLPQVRLDDLRAPAEYESAFGDKNELHRVAVTPHRRHGIRFDYYGINGYTPIVIGQYFDFVHEMAGLRPPVKRRHTLDRKLFVPGRIFSSKILGIKHARVRTDRGYGVVTARRVLPRAVLVREAIELPDLDGQLAYLKRPDFDPRRVILLEETARPASPQQGADRSGDVVTIDAYRPNRIELSASSAVPTYLLLSELFYPGWRATVDGERVPVLRANYLLRAVALEPGSHRIVLTYRPTPFLVGGLVTLALLAGLGVGSWLVSRKRPAAVG